MVGVGVLERVVRLVHKYGILKIFQAILVILLCLYLFYNVSNIPKFVNAALSQNSEKVEQAHDTSVNVRREIKPKIDSLLNETILSLRADRVFIIEMHNGTNNIAGLPFIYGEMTYEEVSGDIEHVDEDYTSINLSRFSFPIYLEKNKTFIGSIDELEQMDKKLATRMRSNDVKFLAITSMFGVDNELGYFGVSYCGDNQPNDIDKLKSKLSSVSQKLSILLDNKNIIK